MKTLEKLTHEDGIFTNVRLIEGCMVGITQTLADAGRELGKAQEDLKAAQRDLEVWRRMACALADRIKMFGLCIPPEEPFGWRELLEKFEKLKGAQNEPLA